MWGVKNYKDFKLTPKLKDSLFNGISTALKVLKLKDKPARIMNRFLDEKIIETFFEENKRRHKKVKEK